MRITLLSLGTRGDVQPLIGLAIALRSAGYNVRLAAGTDLESFVRAYDIDFHPLPCLFGDYLRTETGWSSFAPGRSFYFGIPGIWGAMRANADALFEACWKALEDADAVVCTGTAIPAILILQRYQVSWFLAYFTPAVATGAFPSPSLPISWLGSWGNRLTYKLVARRFVRDGDELTRRWTAMSQSLPSRRGAANGAPEATLCAFSTHVVRRPSDWPANVHVTGFWTVHHPADWMPDPLLVDFIGAGHPPVCIGFGSMPDRQPARLREIVSSALSRARRRGILVMNGSGSTASIRSDVLETGSLPFDWLLPRMGAVVHHGGAGTTAAGLLAGVPNIVVPFFIDQPFWGARVRDLGAGPHPIPRQRLTDKALARAIDAAFDDDRIRSAAERIGRELRAEDGIAEATQIIHQNLNARA